MSSSGAARVLVGAVGYSNLRDHSAGPLLIEELGPLGDAVDIEDLSYSPIDVLFLLQRRPKYDRIVLVGAVARGDPPGTVRRRTVQPRVDASELQGRIAEAVTGVISMDNLVHIVTYFGAMPEDLTVFEIEPAVEAWGPDPTPEVRRAMAHTAALIRDEVSA